MLLFLVDKISLTILIKCSHSVSIWFYVWEIRFYLCFASRRVKKNQTYELTEMKRNKKNLKTVFYFRFSLFHLDEGLYEKIESWCSASGRCDMSVCLNLCVCERDRCREGVVGEKNYTVWYLRQRFRCRDAKEVHVPLFGGVLVSE